MKRIAFYTLGCKVNQADTASMEAIFRSHGYTVVGFNCEADIYVINTCVVTNTGADRQIAADDQSCCAQKPNCFRGCDWLLSTDGGRRSEDNSWC